MPALPRFILLLALGCLASADAVLAQGQLHKCIDARGRTSYQDFPCGEAPRFTPPAAITPAPADAPAETAAVSPSARQLDARVKAAIASGDLDRARALAVTVEQWEWIAEAERARQQQAVSGRTQSDLRAEKSASQACGDARRSYELESRSPESIEKAKQLMYEACGMEAPAALEPAPAVIVTRPRPAAHRPVYQQRRSFARRPGMPETPEAVPESRPGRPGLRVDR